MGNTTHSCVYETDRGDCGYDTLCKLVSDPYTFVVSRQQFPKLMQSQLDEDVAVCTECKKFITQPKLP